jgi:hypothetical protein
MSQIDVLIPLSEINFHQDEILDIKRNELVPLLNDQYQLNLYADQIVNEQSNLLDGVDPFLTQQLSQTIEQLISTLANSKKYLKKRKFNSLQKWLGIDIEYGSGQIEYYKNLDVLLDRANHLSQKLQIEIQQNNQKYAKVVQLRKKMALYIHSANEFLIEYPNFAQNTHPLDNFAERLSKKINTLQTLQASNDIAITQMRLSQQLSFALLDRFKEAQQVLIPAWQYHVKQSQQSYSTTEMEKLDNSRENLIKTLKKSLEKPSKS